MGCVPQEEGLKLPVPALHTVQLEHSILRRSKMMVSRGVAEPVKHRIAGATLHNGAGWLAMEESLRQHFSVAAMVLGFAPHCRHPLQLLCGLCQASPTLLLTWDSLCLTCVPQLIECWYYSC